MARQKSCRKRFCSTCGTLREVEIEDGRCRAPTWGAEDPPSYWLYVRKVWCGTCGRDLGMEQGWEPHSFVPENAFFNTSSDALKRNKIPHWSQYAGKRVRVPEFLQPVHRLFVDDET